MKKITYPLLLTLFSSFAFSQTMRFSEACSPDENIEIAAVGDILLHGQLQRQAAQDSLRHKGLWSAVLPYIQKADIAYANFEGPSAENLTASGVTKPDRGYVTDQQVYSSYPQFNYHPSLVQDVKESGFDIVSTANNHALDRRALGADKTIQEMKKNNLPFTGTRSVEEARSGKSTWAKITTVKNRNIAWIACTFSTNGISDRENQVLPCFQNREYLLGLITQLSENPNIHAVIVTPHWGVEYQLRAHPDQVVLGRQMIEAGATAVIGTHPHVVQPWEKVTTRSGREGFIIYSTGNFVSGQTSLAQVTSVLVQLHLTGPAQARLKIRGVSFLPIVMKHSPRHTAVPVYDVVQSPSQKIWKDAFGEENRILSLQENQLEKMCQNSRK